MRAAQLFLLAALFFTSLDAASAQPSAKTAELKVLDGMLGKWRYELESKPAEWDPKGSKSTGTTTGEWILDGWFQQHKGKTDDGRFEGLEIWSYDEPTKTYRHWGFYAGALAGFPTTRGFHLESTATWDEKSNTLTYKEKGPGDVTTVSTMRFIDKDNREGTRVATDAAGKLFQNVRSKLTRIK